MVFYVNRLGFSAGDTLKYFFSKKIGFDKSVFCENITSLSSADFAQRVYR